MLLAQVSSGWAPPELLSQETEHLKFRKGVLLSGQFKWIEHWTNHLKDYFFASLSTWIFFHAGMIGAMSRKWHTCLCVLNKSLLWMTRYINDLSVCLGSGGTELIFERSGTFSQVTDSVCLQASVSGTVCVSKSVRANCDKGGPDGVFSVFEY